MANLGFKTVEIAFLAFGRFYSDIVNLANVQNLGSGEHWFWYFTPTLHNDHPVTFEIIGKVASDGAALLDDIYVNAYFNNDVTNSDPIAVIGNVYKREFDIDRVMCSVNEKH